jgi:MFS family permease
MSDSRRFRGMVGMAAAWGVALSALATASLAIGLATGVVPSAYFGARDLMAVAVRGLATGAVGGGLFAWLVARRERREHFSTLSGRRMALWGFIAAAAVPGIMALAAGATVIPIGVLAASSLIAGLGGSALSVGMLRVARRAPEALGEGDGEARHLLP